MRWLVTGGSGQLGWDVLEAIRECTPDSEVWAPPRSDLDMASSVDIHRFIAALAPDIVINCAAWTDVDLAEAHPVEAHAVNAGGPASLARSLSDLGTGLLIHVSTDYVFSGASGGPHGEGDPPDPVSVYGRTKHAGELAVKSILSDRSCVVRTAWLYGEHGANFVKTVADRAFSEESLNVVNDQWGQPTWTTDAADRIVAIACAFHRGAVPTGTYHAVNSGSSTWFDLAQEVVRLLGLDPALVTPISSDALTRGAARPRDSRLRDDAARLYGLLPLRSWQSALAAALPTVLGGDA